MLVKLPGPRPTTIASSCARVVDELVDRREQVAGTRRRARGVPSPAAQTAPKDVAVSKAKIVFTRDPYAAVRLVDVVERNRGARGGQPVAAVLRPFDEGDRAVEVRLEVAPLLGSSPARR